MKWKIQPNMFIQSSIIRSSSACIVEGAPRRSRRLSSRDALLRAAPLVPCRPRPSISFSNSSARQPNPQCRSRSAAPHRRPSRRQPRPRSSASRCRTGVGTRKSPVATALRRCCPEAGPEHQIDRGGSPLRCPMLTATRRPACAGHRAICWTKGLKMSADG